MQETVVHWPNAMYWIVILLAVLALGYWFGVYKYSLTANVALNGPKPWPYVGNLPDVIKYGGLHTTLLKYFKRYGHVHKMFLGRIPSIVVSDPEMVKQILVKDFHKFPDRFAFIKPNPPIDSGLFVSRGATWKRVRSSLSQTFSSGKLKQIVPIMDGSTYILIKKMEQFASTGESVDCQRLFSLFALDVIMKSAFGHDTSIQTQPDEEFVDKAKNAFSVPLWIRAFTMFPFSDFLSSYFNILKNADYFLKLAMKMITNRISEGGRGRRDLLQLMLEAHEQKVDGVARLSDNEIAAQSLTFLLAGFETTGNTLSNTAHLLASHPDVQDKLIKELDAARASRGDDTPLYEFIQKIDYLDMVINEVLRLCAPPFLLTRECEEACDIKGVHFPLGVDVNIPLIVLHRDPETWAKPDEFDPEHFSAEAKEKRHPYSFIPFGIGPRMCIGMRFALMEIKINLITVLERFRFERAPETKELVMAGNVLLRSKHPIILKIRKR